MTRRPVSTASVNSVGVLILHTLTSTSLHNPVFRHGRGRLACARAACARRVPTDADTLREKCLGDSGRASWTGLADQIRSASFVFDRRKTAPTLAQRRGWSSAEPRGLFGA